MAKWLNITNYREYIETSVVKRLSRYGNVPVPTELVDNLWIKLKPYVTELSTTYKIDGFTSDDLESYYFMKLYQMLSHGQYNPSKGSARIFMQAFRNLTVDIERMSQRIKKIGLEHPENVIALTTLMTYYEEPSREQEPLNSDFLHAVADSLNSGETELLPLIEPLLSHLGVLESTWPRQILKTELLSITEQNQPTL